MLAMSDEADFTDFHEVNENNFEQIKNKATKIGYADGVNDGRESVFQNGFDQGYKDGLRTSFDLEKFRYFFKNLNIDKIKDKDLLKEKEAYKNLQITESKSHLHFKYLNHPDDSLDFISQKQHEYVEKIMEKFTQELPKATDLLKVQSHTDFM
ncbi:protein YAE1 [Lucilia cuprina]|uniref:protein YAE1 n=1 Tax=Lucilia cuprina TaxID=7375 RepID=UPI001F064AAE|nr:protein YAE1 [Lucilia cuprina]